MRNLTLALLMTSAGLLAQQVDPELAVNNFFRVRSNSKHPTTGNYYPYSPTVPPAYLTSPGVAAGTRGWTYTPKLRSQMGAYGNNFYTVTGVAQSIWVGSAVTTFPAPNHYQFRCGVAPAAPVTGGGPYQMQHAATGADLFSIADAPAVIPNGPIWEITTSIATPIPVPASELCIYLEYRGGEYQDDPNGGQTMGCDYQGGRGPGGQTYCGFTVGTNPRTVTLNVGGYLYRPKCGFLIQEPVLTATGHHANLNYQPLLQGEYYRSIGACAAAWSTAVNGDLWFDVRAGSNYGSTGTAIVFLNLGPAWFPGALPTPWGRLQLDPTDPSFAAMAGIPLVLTNNGTYAGEPNAIVVPTLGASAKGQFLKTQAIVFNAGFTNPALTNSSSILIE